MSSRGDFWSAVDEELDERRDALANELVRAWVLEHPEDALELADLRASLRTLESADNPLRAPRRARLVPIAAAAALLALAALGARLVFPGRTALEELELHPVVAAPALGSVQSWEIVSTTESAGATLTLRTSDGCLSVEHRTADVSSAESAVLSSESLVMR